MSTEAPPITQPVRAQLTAAGGRIPALDGWRGLAIAMVLVDHYLTVLSIRHPIGLGQHGVTVFFVLSGFLITTKLLEHPSLRVFFLRRFFRLMPAAWFYLALLLLASRLLHQPLTTWPEVGASVFFYRNYYTAHGWALATHFWSLSIEEQFYLVWAAFLLLVRRSIARRTAAFAACAVAVFRIALWSHYNHPGVNYRTEVRADALFVGCMAAMLLQDVRFQRLLKRRILAPSCLAIFFICTLSVDRLAPLTESAALALLISATVSNPEALLARTFAWKPIAWLGIVSYSMYLWQEPFIFTRAGDGWGRYAALFVAVPLFSLCSYYFIEQPSTRFGHRITAS